MAIRHKRKPTTGYSWQTADLVDGQIGINTEDGTLHVRKTDDSIETIQNYDDELATKEPVISPKNTAFNKDFGSTTDTTCEGDDPRLSDSRDPTAHTHVEVDITDLDKYTQAEIDASLALKKDDFTENSAFNKNFGAIADTVTEGNDSRLTDDRNPTAHTHVEVDITDLDKYTQSEVDASLATKEPTISPKNSAFNQNYGSTTGTVCEGDDVRLSDNRDPNAHIHPQSDVTDLETDLESKAVWKGNWVSAFYNYNEWVLDGNWGAICINPVGTNDRAGPQPTGESFNVYAGTMNDNLVSAKQVLFGNRYTIQNDGYINGYRIYVTEGNHYIVYIVNDPLGTSIIEQLVDFTASSTGWQDINITQKIILSGAVFDLVAQVNESDATPITWVGDWDYSNPNNANTPSSGEISHANKAIDELRIHYTDNNGGDRTAELQALSIGDQINALGTSWTIQSGSDQGTYISIIVSPATQSSPTGVTEFTFETVTATQIPYGIETDYWLSSSHTVNGLYGADIPYSSIIANNSAYGTDILVQRAVISPDWDIVSYSGSSTGSEGGSTPIEIVDDLVTQDANKALSANQGYVLDQNKASHDDLDQKRDKIAGIVGRGNSWLDFDFGTGELTLIPNASTGQTEFTIWSYNDKYIKTNESIFIPKIDKEYVVYYDNTGTLQYQVPKVDIDLDNEIREKSAIVARITVNPTKSVYNIVIDLRYDVEMSPDTRETFLVTNGTVYKNGLSLTNITVDGTGDDPVDASFSVEDGEIFLADIYYNTASRSQVLTFPAQIPIFYLYNQDWTLKPADDYPMIYGGSVGSDYTGTRLAYNPIDGVFGTGDLVEVPNNDFVCVHYFATTGLYTGIIGVQGQETYTTKANARSGALTEINRLLVSEVIKTYYTPLATVIFKTSNGDANVPKASIVSDELGNDYIDLRLSKVALGSPSESSATSFPQETFNVYDSRGQKLSFNLDYTDPTKSVNVEWTAPPEDIDFRGVPQYRLITKASTPLTANQEISLDVNGYAQGYPATGGEGGSEYTTKSVVVSNLVYSEQLTGVVGYSDGTANTIYYRVGTQQGDGSILWGVESSVSTAGTPIEINAVKMNSGRVCFCWVTDSGDFQAQILQVDTVNQSATGGGVRSYEIGGVTSGDVTFNSREHLVFGYIYQNDTLYNKYSETDNNTSLEDPYNRISISTVGTATKVQVSYDAENILLQYMNTTNDAYWIDVKWYKPVFGTGRYDDFSTARQITTDAIDIGGVESENSNAYGQVKKADGTWQTFYTNYTSGSGFGAVANFGTFLTGKLAHLVNSDSGLSYNILVNSTDYLEVWEGSQSDPGDGFTKVYTSLNQIISTTWNDMATTMFESSWAVLIDGDISINNDIAFISSAITRTDNYIGNAMTSVNVGDDIEIFLGLPVISHAWGQYSAGDIFNLGPYKYQAISDRQVVIIVEEVGAGL